MFSGVITFIKTIFVSLFVGVDFLACNVLLHTKSEQKVIGYCFNAPKIFKNPLKTCIFIKKYTFTIYVRRVRIVI